MHSKTYSYPIKMNYRRDNGQTKRQLRLFILLIAAALIIFFWRPVSGGIFNIFSAKTTPALRAGAVLKEGAQNNVFALFSFKRSLVKENMFLREQLADSEARALDRTFLLAENLELKSFLGRNEKERMVLASVLARPGKSPYDTLVIDIGSNIYYEGIVWRYPRKRYWFQ